MNTLPPSIHNQANPTHQALYTCLWLEAEIITYLRVIGVLDWRRKKGRG